jgi:pimeloyl-ACP methyl ester carboxylesterase
MRRWLVPLLVGALATSSAPVRAEVDPGAGPLPDLSGRQVLEFDPRGDGRIVEVVGDLDTATRIAVIVPGADTTVGNFDTGHGGVLRRSPSWQACQLQAAAGQGTAVVAWLGYDPPEGIGLAAVRSERAVRGAGALVLFVGALLGRRPDATVVLVGHSYGSVVLGHAARRLPPQVTDLVSIGSPGMDVGSAAELGTAARVWAGSAPDDWTLRLPDLRVLGLGHGRNPTRGSFGALPLDASTTVGHDGYFVTGSSSLRALAGIVRSSAGDSPRLRTMTVATRCAISS